MPSSPNPPLVAVVLAAGKGTRMKSRRPKPLHPLLGRRMVDYPLELCHRAGAERILVVVGHQREEIEAALGPETEYVEQSEPRGTGHALVVALQALGEYAGRVLVVHADNVLLTEEAITRLLAAQLERGAAASLLTAEVEDPAAYGRIVRDDRGSFREIVEAAGAPESVLALREINAGAYVFDARRLAEALHRVRADERTGEVYLPGVMAELAGAGHTVVPVVAQDPTVALSVNNRVELAEAIAVLRGRILREHMLNGVTIEDPASTYIDAAVRIGQDSVIKPLTYLCGETVIGEECEIGPNVRITDCELGDRVAVNNAVLAESTVGDETKIGPFAQLRPGCRVGRKVKIGNFVELKKAVVEDRASLGHLAYVGDAFVGEKSNIGAGTITCNYDGKHKHHTHIGRHTFVGSHSTLVAPVKVDDGAFVAAGTVVTEDVPAEALAIGRSRQTNKEEWARKRREAGG